MPSAPDKFPPVGNVQYLDTTTTQSSVVWPPVRDREYSCHCGEKLTRKRLVTKTKKVGSYYEIEGEKMALHCAKCGPVAWEA